MNQTIDGFDIEFRALIGDNFEVGGNYTDIMDAYVDASAHDFRASGRREGHCAFRPGAASSDYP